jgi:hypothetical protein
MLHVQDRIAFVEALELPPTPPELVAVAPPVVQEDTKAGYVDGGSLVSFVAGVKLLHKQDTLNSTLLAQLAANAKYDREKQTVEWYGWYRTVLENVGWVLQSFDFTRYQASGMEFTADKVVLEILSAIATGNDLAVVTATMDALNKLGADDPAVRLFETQSHSAQRGSFQISGASESDGVVVLKIGAFYFSTSEDVTRVLWFKFKSAQTQMYKGSQVMNLDDQVYEQVRQAVLDKLGDKAVTFVKNLNIG